MKTVILDGYTANPGDLSWDGLKKLGDLTVYERTKPEELLERAKDADALLTNKVVIDAAAMAALPCLRYIGVLATGYNVVDIDEAHRRGIAVTNIPAYSTMSVAQMVFAHLLNITHHVERHAQAVRSGAWQSSKDFCFTLQAFQPLRPSPNPSLVGRGEDTSGKLYTPLPTREGLGVGPGSPVGSEVVVFASRWPKESPAIMRQTYVVAIDNADHLVQIVNPYAMLFGEVRQALRRALQRGVRVQFMVSTKSDGKANDDVIGLEMRKLMKRGAEVYYYNNGFHHSKVMMVDSLFCTVGTTNLDARSLCFDYEVNAFIFSPSITHELQRIYADDIRQHCTLLTPEVFKERFPLRRRIRSRIFTIAKRLM